MTLLSVPDNLRVSLSNRQRSRLMWVIITPMVAFGLLWIFYDVIQSARATSRIASCRWNLGIFARAALSYRDAHGGLYPPGTASDRSVPADRALSWMTLVYSYFDRSNSGSLVFNRSAPWDSPENRVPMVRHSHFDEDRNAIGTDYAMPQLYGYHEMLCPTSRVDEESGETHFVGITGLGLDSPRLPQGHARAGMFGYDRQTSANDIKDGLANTMMLVETTEGIGPWIAGGPTTLRAVDPARKPYIGTGRPFGGRHLRGANVAFADGSVQFLRKGINPKVFEALSTVAGGEPLPVRWDH